MKSLFPLLMGGVLLIGTVGCDNVAKTSANAPNAMNETTQAPDAQTAQENQDDATDETRKRQLESDIRAREQRNDATGGDMERADGDLESEVRSKLEANLPASQLAVAAKDGVVSITGTVPTKEQLQKVDTLAMEIKGVSKVNNQVTIGPAQPNRTN